jgi:hypothetical protein
MRARKPQPAAGFPALWDITPDGVWIPCAVTQNTLMVEWGYAAARLFGFGDRSYKINRLYVEFENVAAPEDPVSTPAYDEFELRDYYDNLVAPRDYLRIPLEGDPQLFIGTGYENYFTSGETGNALLFKGVTQGAVGVNGVPFSNGTNSKIFGVGLVAAPVDGDKTQDVLICRAYYAEAAQKLKPASGEVGISWPLTFKPV